MCHIYGYKHSEDESPLNDANFNFLDSQKSNLSESTPEEPDTKTDNWFSRVCKVSCEISIYGFFFSSITLFLRQLINVDIR